MSVEAPRYKLYAALKVARASWDHARERWHDAVRQDFEEEFWNGLDHSVLASLSAMDRLSQVLREVRRDCS